MAGGQAPTRLQVAFEEVAVYFCEEEWRALSARQQQLYKDVMRDNYMALRSLGWAETKPDLVFQIERGEEPWARAALSSRAGANWKCFPPDAEPTALLAFSSTSLEPSSDDPFLPGFLQPSHTPSRCPWAREAELQYEEERGSANKEAEEENLPLGRAVQDGTGPRSKDTGDRVSLSGASWARSPAAERDEPLVHGPGGSSGSCGGLGVDLTHEPALQRAEGPELPALQRQAQSLKENIGSIVQELRTARLHLASIGNALLVCSSQFLSRPTNAPDP
ncbi:zinc finger protein 805-like [Tachyglossus aculeatus]|uniref:zinc finger protein 805-like n=1 Tax=Tachyglossus aculeatus TaxID=9261 RepID=UPI0018F29EFF|nr:zinc finger protein 805-like [Tachyglossus aculeatus]